MAQDWEWFSHIGGDDWGMVYDCFTHMIGHFKRAYCQDIFHRSVKSQKSQHTLPHPGLQTPRPGVLGPEILGYSSTKFTVYF